MKIAFAAVVSFIPFVQGETVNPSGTGVIRLLNTNLCISTADDWGPLTTGYGDDLILKECNENTPTWLLHGAADANPNKIMNTQEIDGAPRCIHPWGGTNTLDAQLKTHPVNGPENYKLESNGQIRAGHSSDGTWLDLCITAVPATVDSPTPLIYLKTCDSSLITQLWTWAPSGVATTCNTYSGCADPTLNRGETVTCTDGCDAIQCCDAPASCSNFDNCAHSTLKNADASCDGDISTCDTAKCCDSPAKCSTHTCLHSTLNNGDLECEGDQNTCDDTRCCKEAANCGDDFSCPSDQFYSKNLGKSVSCVGDATQCTLDRCCEGQHCGLEEWGTGIPFAANTGGVNLDGTNVANIVIDFTFSTPSCVDRKNWLGVTLHESLNPICEGKTDDDNAACSQKTGDETACKEDTDCRYRIPCKTEELQGSDAAPFDITKGTPLVTTTAETQDTKFFINVDTSKLGAANNVYSKATQTTDAKLEFCARPAVVVAQTTVLYRELVLRAEIGMDGSFEDLQIAADSFQADSVQEVDNSISIIADAFACSAGTGNVYTELQGDVTLRPNQVFTLCVVPSKAAVKCESILTLNFAQDRSNAGGLAGFNEDRIVGGNPTNVLLTAVPTTEAVEIEEGGQTIRMSGCVVNSRLEAAYFVATAPKAITLSGSALFDFVSTSGRRLGEKSAQSSTAVNAFGKRSLQEEQTASFDMQVQLSNDQVENNSVKVDAAEHVDGYLATAFAVAAASYVV